ncbi:MAG TPA: hypothetical protein VFZ12_08025 [Dehalococcoidia bacterium]|nr:hypothetical protein [Dehalococcoidia bacterium]
MIEDLIGLTGMLALVGAYLMNLTGRLRSDALAYKLMNLYGAGILAWYGIVRETYIFVALEVVWAVAALQQIIFARSENKA